ncbi:ABC-three component system middle component 7 [Treponema berlinense]|uniref:ABC-three component system middle component 7 n=1 Tax=Treponema berlinense TaxID=225004 RepID=UPI003FD74D7B
MLLPNKMIPYSDSVISKFSVVLTELQKKSQNIHELYKKHKKEFESIQNYIEVLNCLFALNKIQIDKISEEVKLCSMK